MITVYQFGPAWDLIDASPYCIKLIAWLRLNEIPFETREGSKYLRQAPKGKMPYVRLEDGSLIGDSCLIMEHLKDIHGDPLGEGMDDNQWAQTHAISRMLSEHFYWCLVYYRWLDENNWQEHTQRQFFGALGFKGKLIGKIVRSGVRKAMKAQGVGRHSPKEIGEMGCKDLKCLVDLLGDKDYLLGNHPREIDVTAYAFVAGILGAPHQSPILSFAGSSPLTGYYQRLDKTLRSG